MVKHMSRVRKNRFGGTTTGTLCDRFRCEDDGMNLTAVETEVTCKLCLKLMVARS
jgi:hypothetical protein